MATGSGVPGTTGEVSYRELLTPSGFGWFAAVAVGASLGLVVLPLAGPPGFGACRDLPPVTVTASAGVQPAGSEGTAKCGT